MVAIHIYGEGVSKLGHMPMHNQKIQLLNQLGSHPWFTFEPYYLDLATLATTVRCFSKSCLLYGGEMSLMLSAVVDFNKNLNSESRNGLSTGSMSQQTK